MPMVRRLLDAAERMAARPARWRVTLALAACLWALATCSSLPTLVPDLARQPGPPVPLEGARGPLSAAQSQAVLRRLEARGPDTGIFDEHLAREEAIVGSPLTTGNRVRLLQDGPATYQAMLAAILAPATTSTWRPTSSTTTMSAGALRRR
jgi:cardiolipin synthase A/B